MPTRYPRTAFALGPVLVVLTVLATGCSPAPDEKHATSKPAAAEKSAIAEKPATAVAWKPYEEGLAEARSANKPVCLIFYTDWCPHCRNYQKVFDNPEVIQLSQKFVMIHLNKDQNAELSAKYALDGDYIPRTFFLKSDGTLLDKITEQRDTYRYFYSENDPAAVMRSMHAVLELPAAG